MQDIPARKPDIAAGKISALHSSPFSRPCVLHCLNAPDIQLREEKRSIINCLINDFS
jgi:hypothetical protein